MPEMFSPGYDTIREDAATMAGRLHARLSDGIRYVYGVPQGGAIPAMLVADSLELTQVAAPIPGQTFVVDDLVDTGTTLRRYHDQGYTVDAIYRKAHSPAHLAPHAVEVEGWINFPWERDDGEPTDAVVRLLQHIGEDPTRDGLLDTPKRVVKAWRELTSGYVLDPADVLKTTFDVSHDEMIVVRRVPFSSLCEHHVLPFQGHATVAYVPNPDGRIVGLSKLARLVDMYARRLQVQERLTDQIAEAIDTHLTPLGTGVIVTAQHTCMSMRGIQRHGEMVTAKMTGVMRSKPEARAELMSIHNNGG